MPGCHGAGTAERSYPTSEVRGGGQEELPHAPTPEARGGSREDLPPLEARGCGWKNNPRRGLTLLSPVCRDPAIWV